MAYFRKLCQRSYLFTALTISELDLEYIVKRIHYLEKFGKSIAQNNYTRDIKQISKPKELNTNVKRVVER